MTFDILFKSIQSTISINSEEYIHLFKFHYGYPGYDLKKKRVRKILYYLNHRSKSNLSNIKIRLTADQIENIIKSTFNP